MMARDRFEAESLVRPLRYRAAQADWRHLALHHREFDYPYYILRDRLAKADVHSTDDIPFGEGRIARVDGKKVAAYRDASGKLTLLSPVCTHLGCIVRWNEADKTWDCPCHGSRFKPTGVIFVPGPAGKNPLRETVMAAVKERAFQPRQQRPKRREAGACSTRGRPVEQKRTGNLLTECARFGLGWQLL